MKNIKLSNIIYGIILICLLAAGAFLLPGTDFAILIRWGIILFALGVGAMPLASFLFSEFDDRGWLFSKALGLFAGGYVTWVLVCAGILPFTSVSASLVTICLAAISWVVYFIRMRKRENDLISGNQTELFPESGGSGIHIRTILLEEILFLGFLLLWIYLIGFRAEAYGTEKYMDYGFMAAMNRSTTLPARDIWFATENINYYYGGQYYAVYLLKLTGTSVEYGYNAMRALNAAFISVLPFSIVYQMLLAHTKKRGRSVIGGAIALAGVSLAGNMHYVLYGLFGKVFKLSGYEDYWFPSSTRYIGHNPESEVDQCIHEFPSYSSILGDLHAHYVNLIFVLLFLGILTAWMLREQKRITGKAVSFAGAVPVKTGKGESPDPGGSPGEEEWTAAFAPDGTRMTDMTEAAKKAAAEEAIKRSAEAASGHGAGKPEKPADSTDLNDTLKKDVLEESSARDKKLEQIFRRRKILSEIFSPYVLILGILSGIFRWTNYWDFVIYLTVFILSILILAILSRREKKDGSEFLIFAGRIAAAVVIGMLAALPFTLTFESPVSEVALVRYHTPFYQFAVLWGLPIAGAAVYLADRILDRRRAKKESSGEKKTVPDMSNLIAALFAICAIGLILIPEIIYVRDIYEETSPRANTMFKLTYQGFVMFGLMFGYIFVLLLTESRRRVVRILTGVLAGLFALTCGYFPYSVGCWFGNISKTSNRTSLDATAFLAAKYPDDADLIKWLNENISGNPVVLETYGDSYSDNCPISSMTGLPTVEGWYVHEWLWREDIAGLNQRRADIDTIYTSVDEEEVRSLINKYHISYIAVGSCEWEKYENLSEELLRSLGETVYDNGSTFLVDVRSISGEE